MERTIVDVMKGEHAELRPHLEHLDQAAAAKATQPDDELRRALRTVAGFLREHLLAHAAEEEDYLYPVVDRLLGGRRATRTMSRDHIAITERVEAVEALAETVAAAPAVAASARAEGARLLYGLSALLENHFAKEEGIYLSILAEGLSRDEAVALARRLSADAAGSPSA